VFFKVAVLGCGYVGSALIRAVLESGDEVLAIDVSQNQLDNLEQSLIGFKGLHKLQLSLPTKSLPSEAFDFVIITVPTPLSDSGEPNLEFVDNAAKTGVGLLNSSGVMILESTSHPGTTRGILGPAVRALKTDGKLSERGFGFSSERIDPGNSKYGLKNVPKVIAGSDVPTLHKMELFYSRFVDTLVQTDSIEDAEMSKLIENTYRAVNIAMINSVAKVSMSLGVDIYEAVRLAATKPFGFQKFSPGIGVGGHCIPVDPVYLNSAVERVAGGGIDIITEAISVNDGMPEFTVSRVLEVLGKMGIPDQLKAKILLFGVTYKPNSSDLRESPALKVLGSLQSQGFVNLFVMDDQVPELVFPNVKFVTEESLGVLEFDLCLNLTVHDSWNKSSGLIRSNSLLDCSNDPGKFLGRIFGLFS